VIDLPSQGKRCGGLSELIGFVRLQAGATNLTMEQVMDDIEFIKLQELNIKSGEYCKDIFADYDEIEIEDETTSIRDAWQAGKELSLLKGKPESKHQKRKIEPFIVKHYSSDDNPIIKGNSFDGLIVGEDREEAEEFINFINANLAI